ncbi:hypothetical protein ACJ5H2_01545 [Nocardioides sp. R1-1]|uniref:hypothetical protein n=1 Tax=Nocardioides sp. R1-1 TaxID=3383502 RepID=UPI0038D06FE7
MNGSSRSPAPGTVTAVAVHGPGGVLDLSVPVGATLADVARTYAAQAGHHGALALVTLRGEPLAPTADVADSGLVTGALVVAVDPVSQPTTLRRPLWQHGRRGRRTVAPTGATAAVLVLAALVALVAGWCAAVLPEDDRWPVVAVLLGVAALGSVPLGALRSQRALAAPAFGAAAGLALAWDPLAERLPTVVGIAGLCAAVTAALGRALARPADPAAEGLRVWMVVGAGWFVIASVGALAGVAPHVVWAVLLLAAVLAARLVPALAVDVPDRDLLDLDRLAVTAWSARDHVDPGDARNGDDPGRGAVDGPAVRSVAERAARTVTAAAVAVLAVVVVATPLLLATADLPLDRTGTHCLVGFGGAALLLAARSYRHVGAARLLRLAGVVALGALAAVALGVAPGTPGFVSPAAVSGAAVAVAALLVAVALGVGRGWRSPWWSRRAEVAEAVCGALAVASLVVSVGLFRHLWEVVG